MPGKFRFTFGPRNIHEGADVFGPAVRETVAFDRKLELFKSLGFDGVQFHDDDAVPDLSGKTAREIQSEASALVGLDVKAMRTQKDETATCHLSNSLEMFNNLLEISRSMKEEQIQAYIEDRNYEGLDLFIMKHLIGRRD